jgi:hypothetical protein
MSATKKKEIIVNYVNKYSEYSRSLVVRLPFINFTSPIKLFQ